MILKPNWLEPEIVQNVILKFSLVVSLVCYKDTDIEALVPASVSHHCLVLCYVCSPCNRKPLTVRLTDETSFPVVDIGHGLVCCSLAQYITGDLLTAFRKMRH